MNDKRALYKACCENPYEDSLRLIYADCLEENGDSVQANYIRESIALCNLVIDEDKISEVMRWKEKIDESQKMLDNNWEKWILEDENVAAHFDFNEHKIIYSRGMPDKIICGRECLAISRQDFNKGIDIDTCAWMVQSLPLTRIHPNISPRNLYHTNRNKIIESQWRKRAISSYGSEPNIFSTLAGCLPHWLFNETLDERINAYGNNNVIEMDRLTIVDSSGNVHGIRYQTTEEAIECMNIALCKHIRKKVYG